MKIPTESKPTRGAPFGVGVKPFTYACFECEEGQLVAAAHAVCNRCGAQPPTKVRLAIIAARAA